MIAVSPLFTENMSKITRPKLSAEVEFRQLTVGADEDAVFTAVNDSTISQLEQLSNGVTALTDYATLEDGRWLLDGSKDILPDDLNTAGQIGAWGDELSLKNGTFYSNLTVSVDFPTLISSAGLTICFDTAQGTYATSFIIRVYNGATLLSTINASATSAIYVLDSPLVNYDRVEIEVVEWSVEGQRARIAQIMCGIVKIFGDLETVEFSVLRQIDPINRNTPSSELRFAFDNRDGKYDFENPLGIYDYVTLRQEAFARIGFGNELVKLGKYYLSDWETSDGKATFQALDALSLLDVKFADAFYDTQTLTTIATAALSQAGITNYSLDSSLSSITVSVSLADKTCLNVLSNIATAACLTLYCDIDGKIIIGALPTVAEDYTINYTNSAKPKASLEEPLKSITITYGTDLTVSQAYEDYGQEISISDNLFIKTEARANLVLAWLAAYYQRRKIYQNDWRQNPCIECGDIVGVLTDYGTPNATVTSQQYTYSGGGLSGQTKGAGV